MWTIHSVGDSAFLEQVLIAVSMITGTGDFTQMASVGLLIGVLIVFFHLNSESSLIRHVLHVQLLYSFSLAAFQERL